RVEAHAERADAHGADRAAEVLVVRPLVVDRVADRHALGLAVDAAEEDREMLRVAGDRHVRAAVDAGGVADGVGAADGHRAGRPVDQFAYGLVDQRLLGGEQIDAGRLLVRPGDVLYA